MTELTSGPEVGEGSDAIVLAGELASSTPSKESQSFGFNQKPRKKTHKFERHKAK